MSKRKRNRKSVSQRFAVMETVEDATVSEASDDELAEMIAEYQELDSANDDLHDEAYKKSEEAREAANTWAFLGGCYVALLVITLLMGLFFGDSAETGTVEAWAYVGAAFIAMAMLTVGAAYRGMYKSWREQIDIMQDLEAVNRETFGQLTAERRKRRLVTEAAADQAKRVENDGILAETVANVIIDRVNVAMAQDARALSRTLDSLQSAADQIFAELVAQRAKDEIEAAWEVEAAEANLKANPEVARKIDEFLSKDAAEIKAEALERGRPKRGEKPGYKPSPGAQSPEKGSGVPE